VQPDKLWVDVVGNRGGVSYHGCGPNNNKQPNSQTTISYVNAYQLN